jgi:hypothetical protein
MFRRLRTGEETTRQMQFQRCPNCRERNDVSVYVQGQLTRCVRCQLRFAVERPVSPQANDPFVEGVVESQTEVSVLGDRPVTPPPSPADAARPMIASAELFPTPAERPARPAADAAARTNAGYVEGKPQIPGYECVVLLGRGGMGEVWRARQVSLDRPVAVKILSPTLAVEPDFVRRFERESTALAALSHPHIVSVFDRGSANGSWYFVMEFVEGRSLRERVSDGKPSRNELLRLLAQVARAIEYAHKKGVIHRDLKPENVLIDHVGHAKVADFGLAGMSETGRSSLTMTAVAMGTAHYMAPEQRKDAKNVDSRADLYSLGVMLYEMVCSEVPQGRFPTPREKVPDIDRRLDAMIMRLLDQNPEKRPSRASEVADLLDMLTSTDRIVERQVAVPMQPRPQTWSSVLRDFQRLTFAHKSMLVGAALLFVLIIAVAIAKGGSGRVAEVKLPAKIDRGGAGSGRSALVSFAPGGTPDTVLAVGGGWSIQKNELVRELERETPKRAPRAYLLPLRADLENATLDADISFDGLAPGTGDKAPMAELVFYRDRDRHVGLRLSPLEDTPFTLFFAPAVKGKTTWVAAEPRDKTSSATRKYRLQLQMTSGRANASLDGRLIASTIVGLSGLRAKIGFGCRNVRCHFSNVRLQGLVSDTTPPTSAQK